LRSTLSQLLDIIQSNIMATEQRDWYDTPLYYDIIFDADTDREADFLLSAYQRYVKRPVEQPLVLEPACGSGRLMRALHHRRCQVHGFDLSEAMVRYANEHLPDSTHVWTDRMESFRLPTSRKYDFAHCLVSTFKYLLTAEEAEAHLKAVAGALKQGGVYLLGIHLTDYQLSHWEHERWTAQRDGIKVTCNTRTWPAERKTRLEQLRTRLKIEHGNKTKLQETRWQFRTYDAKEVQAMLRRVPQLELIGCHDFTHDIHATRELDDSYSDIVLVLRRC
jgi:SAM-dependent methyltransferase